MDGLPSHFATALLAQKEIDIKFGSASDVGPSLIFCESVPGHRLVFSPTGNLRRDYDDVRRVGEAAASGITRAVSAGDHLLSSFYRIYY